MSVINQDALFLPVINQKFTEKDIVNVKKLGLTLSAFRKIN